MITPVTTPIMNSCYDHTPTLTPFNHFLYLLIMLERKFINCLLLVILEIVVVTIFVPCSSIGKKACWLLTIGFFGNCTNLFATMGPKLQ
jgi:hypothetical protein